MSAGITDSRGPQFSMLSIAWIVVLTALIIVCQQACDRYPEALGTARRGATQTAFLLPGLGRLHHPFTARAEAQAFIDQGLTLVYAFNLEEAWRSFRRASELDPNAAMAYWGMALALGPSYNGPTVGRDQEEAAYKAIQKALDLQDRVSVSEKKYIQALAKRFSSETGIDNDKLNRSYSAAMRDLTQLYPDDPDAATLYAESLMDLHAWNLWTNDGRPGEYTEEIVSVLESVLRRWPDHIGANHYYIHVMEASPHPERALTSAHLMETLVPGAGHLVHMPAHIYLRTGDYSAAVRSSLAAEASDEAYLRKVRVPNIEYELGFADHNLFFLAVSAGMDGEFQTAYDAALQLESKVTPLVGSWPWSEPYLAARTLVLLRFARWDDVLKMETPDLRLAVPAFFWHYARACALAQKGQADKAEAEADSMNKDFERLPGNETSDMMFGDWEILHRLAMETVSARLAAASSDSAQAISHWRKAVDLQDGMHYHEPPEWFYPIRESLGSALLRIGQAADAEQTFREDLVRNPRNPRSLYGLYRALEAEGRSLDSVWVQKSFQAAWKGKTDALRLDDF